MSGLGWKADEDGAQSVREFCGCGAVGEAEDPIGSLLLGRGHVPAVDTEEGSQSCECRPLVDIDEQLALRNPVGKDRRLHSKIGSTVDRVPERASDGAFQAVGAPQLVGCLPVGAAEDVGMEPDHIVIGEVADLFFVPLIGAHDQRVDVRTSFRSCVARISRASRSSAMTWRPMSRIRALTASVRTSRRAPSGISSRRTSVPGV